jgi:hypothetical protein
MFELLETEPDFLNRVIIGDESWFFEYDPENKRQRGTAHATVSKTEERSHEQIKNQENDHNFLRFQRGSSLRICTIWCHSHSESKILS